MNSRGPGFQSAGPRGTKRHISSVDAVERSPRGAKKRLVIPAVEGWLRLAIRIILPPAAGREWSLIPHFPIRIQQPLTPDPSMDLTNNEPFACNLGSQ